MVPSGQWIRSARALAPFSPYPLIQLIPGTGVKCRGLRLIRLLLLVPMTVLKKKLVGKDMW
jgi:hypothetical protein